MDATRIAALLEPFLSGPLSAHQFDQISTYIDLLLRWNARTNLTAVRDPEEIVTRHFGECLFAAQALFPSTANSATPFGREAQDLRSGDVSGEHAGAANHRVQLTAVEKSSSTETLDPPPLDLLDLGSGAGFPGIPIHLWAANLHTTLIESQQKKVAFLREVIRNLTLTNIDVFAGRAEDFPSAARLVTLRAVERFDRVLPIAARLVVPGGRLALLVAGPQVEAAQVELGAFRWRSLFAIPQASSRALLVGART